VILLALGALGAAYMAVVLVGAAAWVTVAVAGALWRLWQRLRLTRRGTSGTIPT
jgi:hypothetical protein